MNNKTKGIWIPISIWKNKDLTITERVILAEINSLENLNGCFISNNKLGEFVGLSGSRISQIISHLKKLNYISINFFYKEGGKEVEKRLIRINKEKVYIDDKDKYREEISEEYSIQQNKSVELYVHTCGKHGQATPYQGYSYVETYMIVHPEKASEIRRLSYKEFLNHWYWKAIARYVKDRADNKCTLCNSKEKLNVHHKNYNIKGYEYIFENLSEGLICLCQKCHERHHEIVKVEEDGE